MVIDQFNKPKKGTCYQVGNYLCTGLPANFWVYKLQRKNAPNCTGRIAEYRSRVNNHCSWCPVRVLTSETAAKCKDNKNEMCRWRPTERSFQHLTGNSKSEHVVEMQPNVEWHAVYRPRRIQKTFIRVWYDRMMTTIKQRYPKRQVISVFKVASSFARTPRWADDQRERTYLQLCTCAWRLGA